MISDPRAGRNKSDSCAGRVREMHRVHEQAGCMIVRAVKPRRE
jgi:hypothetical protein